MVAQGDVPWALDHQPGGAVGQFPPRDRTAVWQQHFAVMAELEPAHAPSEATWKRIEAAIRADDVLAPATAAAGDGG